MIACGLGCVGPAADQRAIISRCRGAPWLRAVLQPSGLLEDTGFGYSPHDYLDLLETLQSIATLGQQQVLAEGLKEALWRRDGRRRTYFCCLYSPAPHPHLVSRHSIAGIWVTCSSSGLHSSQDPSEICAGRTRAEPTGRSSIRSSAAASGCWT